MDRVLGTEFDGIITLFEGDSPYGENVQYGERYEAIQQEIRKLTAASSKEISVDWKVIRNLSTEVLTKESKDLSIACFLAVALFLEDGYGGVRDGLEIVNTFVADHWDGIFPPRDVRRANDLRWLVDRLAPLVRTREVTLQDLDHLESLVDHTAALSEHARERLREKAPGFGELVSALKAKLDEARKLAPPASAPELSEQPEDDAIVDTAIPDEPRKTGEEKHRPPTPDQQEGGKSHTPASASLHAAPDLVGVSMEEGASASEIRTRLEAVIKPLRDAEPLNPAPYKILRILKWDGVSGPTAPGETRIPGPRPNELTPLQTMFQSANWKGLLNLSENMFKSGHIWLLDLQRYTALCLENLDPNGALSPAADAVKAATRVLLKRNPTLVDCAYAGGIPFASDEARAWLTEVLAADNSRVGLARAVETDTENAAFQPGDLGRAIELLRTKQLTEGMEVLQQGIRRASDRRSQFRARLDAARACLDANQPTWARPMLEALQKEAGALTFDAWEPRWAVELYQLLAICYGRLVKASKGSEQQAFSSLLNQIQDALCRLDIQAAAAIQEEL